MPLEVGDLRRLAYQYGRPIETVFPTGRFNGSASQRFGTDVSFPVPFAEANNPNVPANETCMNRNP